MPQAERASINFAKVETPPTLVFQNERHYSYGYNIQWLVAVLCVIMFALEASGCEPP